MERLLSAAAWLASPHTPAACLPTGIASLDQAFQGLPRGAISELHGPRSSGRGSLLSALLAQASGQGEYAALLDAWDGFDPHSAARAGVKLEQVVWVRCRGNVAAAMRAADLIVHGGGFGLVCLDLAGTPAKTLNRIPQSWWFRFQRAVAKTRTVLLVLGDQPLAKSCAACRLELRPAGVEWGGSGQYPLLCGLEAQVTARKPAAPPARFCAKAV